MAVLGAVIGAGEFGLGLAEKADAKKKAAAALSKRRAYQTPEEVYKVLNATEQNAQSGLGSFALNYETNQIDQTFSNSASAAEKLGGDPNDLSLLFNNKVNAIMGVEAQDHQLRTQNFSQYLSALSSLGQSKDAEFFSQQNLVKDAQQQAAIAKQVATGQINAGLTTGVESLSALAASSLYTDNQDTGGNDFIGSGSNKKPKKQQKDILDQNGTFKGYTSSTFQG